MRVKTSKNLISLKKPKDPCLAIEKLPLMTLDTASDIARAQFKVTWLVDGALTSSTDRFGRSGCWPHPEWPHVEYAGQRTGASMALASPVWWSLVHDFLLVNNFIPFLQRVYKIGNYLPEYRPHRDDINVSPEHESGGRAALPVADFFLKENL